MECLDVHLHRINFIKGVAIFLVVLGHNHLLTGAIDGLFSYVYLFHVDLFFLIMAVRPSRQISYQRTLDLCVRYLSPFFFFTVAMGFVFHMTLGAGVPFSSFILQLVLALFIGSAQLLDVATGFQLFWFLPSLLSLSLLWALGANCRFPVLCIFVATIGHLLIGLVGLDVAKWVPLGTMQSVFVLLLLFILNSVNRLYSVFEMNFWIVLLIFLMFSCAAVVTGFEVNIGYGIIPSIARPTELLITDALIISSFILLATMPWVRFLSGIFVALGEDSMYIFLTHQIAFQFFLILSRFFFRDSLENSVVFSIVFGLILIPTTISFGLIFGRLVESRRLLRKILFPRSFKDFVSLSAPSI